MQDFPQKTFFNKPIPKAKFYEKLPVTQVVTGVLGDDGEPKRAIFHNSYFASIQQKINLEEIFKLFSPSIIVKEI